MRLGLMAGYWSAGPPFGVEDELATAEDLGFDSFWTAEAYGSDALTPLAWWGSNTTSLDLGTAITQMSARTPAATAMAAMTMDHLTSGRFRLGLGASGPQVVEGWYGEAYPKPLARTREYVDVVRAIVARDEGVTYEGDFYQLPYRGGTGLSKPLKSTIHPLRSNIPIYLGAQGPKNVALAAEICDGWLPFLFSPHQNGFYRIALQDGFDRPAARRGWTTSTSQPWFPSSSTTTWTRESIFCVQCSRSTSAAWVPRRSTSTMTCSCAWATKRPVRPSRTPISPATRKQHSGRCQPSWRRRSRWVGPPEKIRDDLEAWEESVVKTLLINGPPEIMRMMAGFVL